MTKFIFIVFLAFLVSGCQSCLNKFYRVHESQTPINITFEQEISSSLLNSYIDSLNQSNREERFNCTPIPIVIDQDDKVVCFSESPCECYLLSIKENRVTILAVYAPQVNDRSWVTKREQVNDTVLYRVERRFRNEILAKLRAKSP